VSSSRLQPLERKRVTLTLTLTPPKERAMLTNRRFKVVIELQFDVREDQTLCGERLYNYTTTDWTNNIEGIVEDNGVLEFLPKFEGVFVNVKEV
jgi:hypothetical protein